MTLRQYIFCDEVDTEFSYIHEGDRERFRTWAGDIRSNLRNFVDDNRGALPKPVVSDLWKRFYAWRKMHDAPVTYAYALTTHKSQGSSFESVYIDAENVEECCQHDPGLMKRCLYTAVSRAKEKLVIMW
jgi:hypothetical protein